MAELGWTKATEQSKPTIASKPAFLERLKYFVGGGALLTYPLHRGGGDGALSRSHGGRDREK